MRAGSLALYGRKVVPTCYKKGPALISLGPWWPRRIELIVTGRAPTALVPLISTTPPCLALVFFVFCSCAHPTTVFPNQETRPHPLDPTLALTLFARSHLRLSTRGEHPNTRLTRPRRIDATTRHLSLLLLCAYRQIDATGTWVSESKNRALAFFGPMDTRAWSRRGCLSVTMYRARGRPRSVPLCP